MSSEIPATNKTGNCGDGENIDGVVNGRFAQPGNRLHDDSQNDGLDTVEEVFAVGG